MTGALDTLALNQGLALLSKFGKALTLSRTTVGTYDPDSLTTAAGSTLTSPAYGIIDAYSLQGFGSAYQQGLVHTGDQKALVAAKGLTFDPAEGDTLTVGGVIWTVVRVQPIWSGEKVALWDLQVRR